MQSTVALSTRSSTKDAVPEIIDRLRQGSRGDRPDLVVLFATPHHLEEIESLTNAIQREFAPGCLLGCGASGLIGGQREIESEPALVAVCAHLPGVSLEPFHVTFRLEGDSGRLSGFPFDEIARSEQASVLMFSDPFSLPVDALLRLANEKNPGTAIVGGLASAAVAPGLNRLFLEDSVYDEGAIGVVISGDILVKTLVSQGCRPVGRHYVITRGRQNVIEELGGQPALARLQEVRRVLSERDREHLDTALHIGRAIDEYRSDFRRGDFLVRSVLGVDQASGALTISDYIRRGQTIQFHVRDPRSASEDMDLLLREIAPFLREHEPCGGLLFSCNGRGKRMFGVENHDVSAVLKNVPGLPLAGFFAGGELGPVGGKNFLHGFTASLALFCRK